MQMPAAMSAEASIGRSGRDPGIAQPEDKPDRTKTAGPQQPTHWRVEEKVGKKRRFSPERIIAMLREAEVRQSHGERIGEICETFGVSEQSYYRWRRQYGGLRPDQAQRMQQLEQENARLRKAVSALSLDKAILCDALSRNF